MRGETRKSIAATILTRPACCLSCSTPRHSRYRADLPARWNRSAASPYLPKPKSTFPRSKLSTASGEAPVQLLVLPGRIRVAAARNSASGVPSSWGDAARASSSGAKSQTLGFVAQLLGLCVRQFESELHPRTEARATSPTNGQPQRRRLAKRRQAGTSACSRRRPLKHLFRRQARGEQVQHVGHTDTQAPHTGTAATLFGVRRNAFSYCGHGRFLCNRTHTAIMDIQLRLLVLPT